MNFGKTDILILLTMSLAIIGMSFVFPALGLTDENAVDDDDIPDFDVATDRFEFAGDFPTAPRTPTEGTLDFDSSLPSEGSNNRVWLEGDTSGGYEMFLSEESNGTGQVTINEWDGDEVVGESNETFTSDNETFVVVQNDYGVRFDVQRVEDPEYEVRYTVTSRPNEGEGIIGSVVGTVGNTAETLAWFGQIIYWVSISIIEVSINAITALASVTSYLIGLIGFLISTYTGIISAAGGFASVFVAIPGILLSAVLAKMVFIGISLLPTT